MRNSLAVTVKTEECWVATRAPAGRPGLLASAQPIWPQALPSCAARGPGRQGPLTVPQGRETRVGAPGFATYPSQHMGWLLGSQGNCAQAPQPLRLLWPVSHLVTSDSLRQHGPQHARLLCPSPPPGALFLFFGCTSQLAGS